ncbi:MAG: hypothetical protein K2Q18_08165 [Bdellovibrionales bacterium]|nr:hypothetical protein [Bdellovibrionales bacterium]
MKGHFFKSKSFLIFITSTVVIIALGYLKYESDLKNLKKAYVKEQSAKTREIAEMFESRIHIAYQTIRTISLLPGVMKLENLGEHADENSKSTIQQLYNNAYGDIKLSEIYIISKNFNPSNVIDPKTNQKEEPIEKFDEFIVGDKKEEEVQIKEDEDKDKLEEVEDEEYRVILNQIAYFKSNFNKRDSFKDIQVPMLTGEEVITCDNSEFTKADLEKKNNAPRNGIILTVPKYSSKGELNGVVSAILRTNVMLSYLPESNYALINGHYHNYFISKPHKGILDLIEKISKNPKSSVSSNLIYSEKININLEDQNPWELLVAIPDSVFYTSAEYTSIRNIFLTSFLIAIVLALVILYFLRKSFHNNLIMTKIIYDLSESSMVLTNSAESVHTATTSMTDVSKDQAKATEEVAVAVEEISKMSQRSLENVNDLISISTKSNASSLTTVTAVTELGKALMTISKNEARILSQVEENGTKMQEILSFINDISLKTKVIDDIVFQTKLLSFNASVEAARAGEQGKGFAVVAEEVGKLAQNSGEAANEINNMLKEGMDRIKSIVDDSNLKIKDLIDQGNTSLKEGEKLSKDSIERLNLLSDLSNNVQLKVQEISSAISEQNNCLIEIEKSSNQFRTSTNETIVLTTKNSVVAQQMLDQSVAVMNTLKNFKKII